jgi:hypothetical protein
MLSLFADFENFSVFKPAALQGQPMLNLLKQLIRWARQSKRSATASLTKAAVVLLVGVLYLRDLHPWKKGLGIPLCHFIAQVAATYCAGNGCQSLSIAPTDLTAY